MDYYGFTKGTFLKSYFHKYFASESDICPVWIYISMKFMKKVLLFVNFQNFPKISDLV